MFKFTSRNWMTYGVIVAALILLLLYIFQLYPFQPQNPEPDNDTGQEYDYEVMTIDAAPAAIYEKYEGQKMEQGYSVNQYDGAYYVLITMGQVSSGGYEVQVQDVSVQAGHWKIQTHFKSPKPGEYVTTVISYPATVVKLMGSVEKVDVLKGNTPLKNLNGF